MHYSLKSPCSLKEQLFNYFKKIMGICYSNRMKHIHISCEKNSYAILDVTRSGTCN